MLLLPLGLGLLPLRLWVLGATAAGRPGPLATGRSPGRSRGRVRLPRDGARQIKLDAEHLDTEEGALR